MTPRDGFYMTTGTGIRIYMDDPRPSDFNIKDIAHGLSNTCRYNGQCVSFYSVAEHCIRGSKRASEAEHLADYSYPEVMLAYEFLMHDASEAYMGDMVHGLKQFMPHYQEVEANFMRVIARKFGFPEVITNDAKDIDARMLVTEAPAMFTHGDHWWLEPSRPEPYPNEWVRNRFAPLVEDSRGDNAGTARLIDASFMPPRQAKRLFVERFHALRARIDAMKG